MIRKKLLLSFAMFIMTLAIKAQMVNGNAYIKGTFIEIGIDSSGGYEGVDTAAAFPLPGMHYRSNQPFFGFVANPQNNLWATFDGDYFTPGSPENGWGFEIGVTGGPNGSNNCASTSSSDGVPGMVTNWSHIGTAISVDWEGSSTTAGLGFRINYLLNEMDLFYTTTVTVINNSGSTISDIYYYRNLDPDNNVTLTSDYTTMNTIVSQPVPGGTSVAEVNATQSTPWFSGFTFLAVDTNFKAGHGGFANRDASDMYNGGFGFNHTVGTATFADEAIFLAYRIDSLLPGDTAVFKFCSVFDTSAVECAMTALGVSLTTPNTVINTDPAFSLTGGTPAGGTYSGPGVVGGNMFDPSVSGTGTFTILYSYTDSAGCTGTASSAINVDLAAGVSEEVINNAVSIYPNPFSSLATVMISKDLKLQNAEFRLYDVLGKEVIAMNNITTNEIRLDQKHLLPGVYFYKFNNNGKTISSGKVLVK
jgi:hypothetical protein